MSTLALALLLISPPRAPSEITGWQDGTMRPFIAGRFDVGGLNRATAVVGYGKPHWTWIGVEGSALATIDFRALYAGVRASLIIADVAVGVRDTWSFTHVALPGAQAHYTLDDIRASGPRARYRAIDASLSGILPAPHVLVAYEGALVRTLGEDAKRDRYEEWIRAVVRGPTAWVARLGLAARLRDDKLFLGFLTELVASSDRPVIVRAGPTVSWIISPHLDLAWAWTFPIRSPDTLGIWDGTWGTLRLRWSIATGDPRPVLW